MSKLNFVFVSDNVAKKMALQTRDILDLIPTNQKYSKEFEDLLCEKYGYGFTESYDDEYYAIPDYIDEAAIFSWSIMGELYSMQPLYTYPELASKTLIK